MPDQLWDSTEMNVIVSIDPWMMSDEYRNVISPGLQTECDQPWTPDGVWSVLDSRWSVISPGLQTMKYIVIASLLVVEARVQVTEHLYHKSILSSTPCHAWEVILVVIGK